MFGPFRPSLTALGGLLWKSPWRLSTTRKDRVRERLRNVDELIATLARSSIGVHSAPHAAHAGRQRIAGAAVGAGAPGSTSAALASRIAGSSGAAAAVVRSSPGAGGPSLALRRALALPTEAQMPARDKYTTYNMRSKGYRKSVHKVPKWTRLTLRENPKGF